MTAPRRSFSKREPIELDPQRCFSARQRAEIFARAGGRCEVDECGKKITGPWVAGHIKPHSLGGRTTTDNGRVECPECCIDTQAEDTTIAAKCERMAGRKGQYARRMKRGGSLIQGAGFPGHRRMNGEIVWNNR